MSSLDQESLKNMTQYHRLSVYDNQVRIFLWKIYAYSFLDQFILLFTSYSLFFRDSGLQPLQIGVLYGILPVTTFIFEVPTGVLADTYSRRTLLSLAQLLRAVAFLLWFIFQNYVSFAAGFALWGLSMTLISGTFESFVYDELKHFNREKEYERVRGRIDASHFAGLTLATFFGGFVAAFGYEMVFIPSIAIPLAAASVILMTRPVHAVRSTGERQYWHIVCGAFTEMRGNPYLLRIMVYFAVSFGVIEGSNEFWVLYFGERGVVLGEIGIILAMANAATVLAGFTTHHWRAAERTMYLLMLVAGAVAIASTMFSTLASVCFSLIFCYTSQIAIIKCETRLQHAAQSHQRATVTSIRSLLTQMVTFVYFLVVGLLAEYFGYGSFFWLVGGVIGILSVIYMFLRYPRHVNE